MVTISEAKNESMYPVAVSQFKGTVLPLRIIFFHQLSVPILISVVFKTMSGFFLFLARYYADLSVF